MRAWWLAIALMGCNQILGSSVTGSSDVTPDGGTVDGGQLADDAMTIGGDGAPDDPVAQCTWIAPAQIASPAPRPSLAVGANGVVHVVHDVGDDSIAYRSLAPGGTWSAAMQIGTESYPRTNGAIAVDSANVVHLVVKTYPYDLEYMVRAPGGSWSEPTYWQDAYPHYSLAVGPLGATVVAAGDFRFYTGRPGSGPWTMSSLGYFGAYAHRPGITVSSTGATALSGALSELTNNVRTQSVVVAERGLADSTWRSATVDQIPNSIAANVYGDSTAVALDAAGTQHVVFSLGPPNDRSLTYRRRVANSVPGPREDPDSATLVDDVAAVVDSDGNVHVLYQDVVRGNLRYIRRDATGGWSTPVEINAEGAGGDELSLAIDGTQRLHAIWTDSQQRLFYTSRCTSP